jgi:hypothetical protein
VPYPGLSSLTLLNLEGNWINVIPDFCKDGLHNLTRLRLSSTKLYTLNHLRNHTKCLTRLSLISLELNWMVLCDKSKSMRFGQFLNKELGSKNPFCAIPCVNVKPSALENVKDVKEELLNAFGCILVSWDDILHNLTRLRLSSTKLYTLNHLRNHTKCLTRLTNINLSGISLRIIPNNIFSKTTFHQMELNNCDLIRFW